MKRITLTLLAFMLIYASATAQNGMNLTVNASDGGTVTGAGEYAEGAEVTIEAIPNAGRAFVEWNDGNTENPRTIILTQDTAFSARFSIDLTGNFLTNGDVSNGAEGWTISNTDDATAANNMLETSHDEVAISQEIDLMAKGFSESELDAAPQLCVGGDITLASYGGARRDGIVIMKAICKDANRAELQTVALKEDRAVQTGFPWTTFLDTTLLPVGTRYISFEMVGKDYMNWSGYYGPKFDNLFVGLYCGTVSITVDAGEGGTVTGTGVYAEGAEVTIEAIPDAGRVFVEWNDGNTDNPRTITVTQDSAFVAEFEASDITCTLSVTGIEGGSVTAGGTYPINSQLTIEATPDDGYRFVEWNDGVTDNPRTVILTQDSSLVAVFVSYECVDLGLTSGTLWATFNVGAYSPEGYGDYFAWGETEPKTEYSWDTYAFGNAEEDELTKYCSDASHGLNGFVDNKSTLDSIDDAAAVNWGGKWRMPTDDEYEELVKECNWQYVADYNNTGVKGYIVSSKAEDNANSIFIPLSGYRSGSDFLDDGLSAYYWSSTLDSYWCARDFYCYNDNAIYTGYAGRYYGSSVRPVQSAVKHTVSTDADYGTVTGAGECVSGRTVTLTVVPSAGYVFTQWSDGNTDNPRTITVTQDSAFVAEFEASDITCTLSVTVIEGGSVTAGGTYPINSQLTIEATPDDGYRFVEWSDGVTDNPRTVILSQDSSLMAVFNVFNFEYVDLGLTSGTLWATFNVGAYSPEGYGDYFAWGETEPKTEYSWDTYAFGNGEEGELTKYCSNADYGHNGYTDTLSSLTSADDAATVNWGSNWRMPTISECEELLVECNWQWTDDYNGSGVAGYIVSSTEEGNNNSIFLPATGYCEKTGPQGIGSYAFYWTSSLDLISPSNAYYWEFNPGNYLSLSYYRYYGQSVRAVYVPDGVITDVPNVDVVEDEEQVRKVFENGVIYIIRGNEKYTVHGVKVK